MTSFADTDPIELSQRLIRCASVTPKDEGALDILAVLLGEAGFECHRPDRNGVGNLFARWGPKGHPQTFGFNGHTDVVPPGDANDWTVPPFSAEIRDGQLWGRGAADMKTGVACFVSAAVDFVRTTPPDGALILTVTGDEEGPGIDGTRAILDWMDHEGERMADCLVGEPTCPETMGEMIKIGRRGSMTAWITVAGVQGHAAYPSRARNPVHAIARLADRLASAALDTGTEHFDPSTLAITSIDVGNAANNVIPAKARMMVNIRFNDAHSSELLTTWLREQTSAIEKDFGVTVQVEVNVSGESFLTPPGPLSDLVASVVEAETGHRPVLSTSGGTSDARFVRNHCPVVEFGLVGATMHQVDERVEIAHVEALKRVYSGVLRAYFA